jgi:hypothetical protein
MSPQYHVAYVDGRYQVYRTLTGIDRTNVGPRWSTPAEANRYADRLAAMPDVSPVRSGSDGQGPAPLASRMSDPEPSGERSVRLGGAG